MVPFRAAFRITVLVVALAPLPLLAAAASKQDLVRNASTWLATEDMLGIPLVLAGPMKDGSRPFISVTPLGAKGRALLQESHTSRFLSSFEKDKRDELGPKGGAVSHVGRAPRSLTRCKTTSGFETDFTLQGRSFHEVTLYVDDGSEASHLKLLSPALQKDAARAELKKVAEALCEKR